ncbi:MAG: hypothetical protein U1F11_13265 [Steroidobacteraceae bacterium]
MQSIRASSRSKVSSARARALHRARLGDAQLLCIEQRLVVRGDRVEELRTASHLLRHRGRAIVGNRGGGDLRSFRIDAQARQAIAADDLDLAQRGDRECAAQERVLEPGVVEADAVSDAQVLDANGLPAHGLRPQPFAPLEAR